MTEKFLIETDLLFGLRPSDKLHEKILSFFAQREPKRKNIYLSSASLLEVPLVLYGKGISNSIIQETISTMKLALQRLTSYYIHDIQFEDIMLAMSLRETYGSSFFDAIHISIAVNNNLILVTSDKGIADTISQHGGKNHSLFES